MAMLVVLVPGAEAELSLEPTAVARLGRLGVTSVDLVSGGEITGLVIEGWAFDPARSVGAVLAVLGCSSSGARALQPLLHVAVSPAAG